MGLYALNWNIIAELWDVHLKNFMTKLKLKREGPLWTFFSENIFDGI